MSDVMLFGVLRMPYKMAMSNEISRHQFYQRAQEAADRLEAAERSPAEPAPASTGREEISLPRPMCTYADHSYPAYSAKQVREILAADRASRSTLIAARELDVEAELRDVLEVYAESYDMMARMKEGNTVACTSVAYDIRRNMVDAVLRVVRAAAGTQPESTQVSTEQAGDAPRVTYRLLDPRDIIEATDEWLAGDAVTWAVNPYRLFDGHAYCEAMLPARRRVALSPNNSPVGAGSGIEVK